MAHPPRTIPPVGNSSTSWENRCQREEGLARVGVPGRQERVGRHHPGEPLGVLAHQTQADEPAPVLADQRHVPQVEAVEEELAHPLDVAGERVVRTLARLVRPPEADQVRGHDLQAGPGEDRDHLAVQVAPRGLAVHEQHERRGGIALAHVVHPQAAAVAVGDLGVVGGEVVAGQAGEAVIGSAQGLHAGREPTPRAPVPAPGGPPCGARPAPARSNLTPASPTCTDGPIREGAAP